MMSVIMWKRQARLPSVHAAADSAWNASSSTAVELISFW